MRYRTSATKDTVTVDLWTVEGDVTRRIAPAEGLATLLFVRRLTPDVARLSIALREPSRFKVFDAGERITVMVFPQRLSAVPVPRSVGYERLMVTTGAGRARAHVVTLDPRAGGLTIRPVLGGAAVAATEPTSLAATRHEALAAINGTFYSRAGLPLGLIVINGRLLSAPLPRRTVFAVDTTGRPWIGTVEFSGRLVTDSGLEIPISAINRPPGWGGVALYTPEFGPMTFPQALVVLVRHDRVAGFSRGRPVIPSDGYAVAAAQAQQDLLLRLWRGQQITLDLNLSPPGIEHALQGGPRLVRGGEVSIPYDWEGFRGGFYRLRTARSAIGITAVGKILFVTVDGRGRASTGMSLPELAALMARLGARDAMNLDGGGSATLVVGGRVVSALPRGGERTVSSMLVALRRPAERTP
ncbi:MAG: hypothetical protein A2Z07_06570 [Armatimonadetes bacterium RBG_16_67_12]|nr:MAG: hypothetical protein A2Z07_06570 [Armatimonadetes bacterium RBG_16_67_12]